MGNSPDKSLKELDREIIKKDPTLKNVKPSQRERLIQETLSVVAISKSHSGPLPDVETLRGYDELIPNGAERLMQQVEKQGDHRRSLESSVVKSNNIESFIGQIFGLIIASLFLYACYQLAMAGHDAVAGVLGGATLISLVTIFVVGKKSQKD